ncbi:ABC transporter ATP-binding protein [Jiella pelagia]|uniref:ABC transporter ATP-binding protein n=1 Tax=Jiella pelagia TaxID=2986949 RepID=A0ABY7C298_9HYPH|nr:ABC transporter ATP-binding protein [Jiella pelagia]WAP70143.1 ABC transporter ATP-binding protein [Jiella pelagia]
MAILELRNVDKFFDDFVAVDRVSLSIEEGEFFTIVGPSGSGKTTMIRMLVGMDKPTNGQILLRGEAINDVPANLRPTCMVFQSLALFPHMTVGGNVEYSMKCKGVPKPERRRRALHFLSVAHLPESYYDKPVTQCSGGERQRVAIARALAFDPEILFFDEPLSAIDYRLRKVLERELKDIQRATGKTFVYITHSLEEAMVMSDRIAVMRKGRIAQIGTPNEIYRSPNSHFVSEFMGEVNSFKVRPEKAGSLVDVESGRAIIVEPDAAPAGFKAGVLVVRPEDMLMGRQIPAGAACILKGRIVNEYVLGSRVQYQVRSGESLYLVEKIRATEDAEGIGSDVEIGWRPGDARVFDEPLQ